MKTFILTISPALLLFSQANAHLLNGSFETPDVSLDNLHYAMVSAVPSSMWTASSSVTYFVDDTNTLFGLSQDGNQKLH